MTGGPRRGLLSRPDDAGVTRSSAAMALRSWTRRRRVPLGVGLLVVATGLAFSFLWLPLTGGGSAWVQSGDLWATFRSAQYVAWGDIGDISRAITLPGIAVLLAPVALVSRALDLSVAYPMSLPHPTAWLVLGPTELVLGALVLLPLDELAVRHGVRGARRVVLCVAEGIVLWPLVAIWGHPEDALAVAAAVKCLMAASDRRWRATGWWFGLAVVMQPVVLVLLPLIGLGLVRGILRRLVFLARSAAPSAALLAIPLARDWHRTVKTVLEQANYPTLNHPTPWLFLAPVLRPGHWVTTQVAYRSVSGFTVHTSHRYIGAVVGTGPGHLLALGFAVLVGLWAWRRPPTLSGVLWLAAASLALRCVFESVETPYYVWPMLALVLVAAAGRPGWRFPLVLATSASATVFAEYHLGPWTWYLPLMLLLGIGLACAWPEGGIRSEPDVAHLGVGRSVGRFRFALFS